MSRILLSLMLICIGVIAIVVGVTYPLQGPLLVPLGGGLAILGNCLTKRGRRLVAILLRRPLLVCGIMPSLMLAIYVGTFWYWWQRSPVEHFTSKTGRKIRVVQFQFNAFSWHTQVLWIPAFQFMKSVCGYKEGGFVAMYEHSEIEYLRFEDGR